MIMIENLLKNKTVLGRLEQATSKRKAKIKSKELAKFSMKFSDYWHKEICILIPIIVVWTVLLVMIYFKI